MLVPEALKKLQSSFGNMTNTRVSLDKIAKKPSAQDEAPQTKTTVAARNTWSKSIIDSDSEDEDEEESSASEEDEEVEEDEDADEEQNEFIDDEVASVDNYESGDSMDEEEREEMRLNAIDEDGESVGSLSSDEEDDNEDEDSMDSFIVSDAEEDDVEDSDHSVNVAKPKQKRFNRIMDSDSESDADDVDDQMEAGVEPTSSTDAVAVADVNPAHVEVSVAMDKDRMMVVDEDVDMESAGEEAPEKTPAQAQQIEANAMAEQLKAGEAVPNEADQLPKMPEVVQTNGSELVKEAEAATREVGAKDHEVMDATDIENVRNTVVGTILSHKRFSLPGVRYLSKQSKNLKNFGDTTENENSLEAAHIPAIAEEHDTVTDVVAINSETQPQENGVMSANNVSPMDSSEADTQDLSKCSESSTNEENNNGRISKRNKG